eukprot:6042434-Prymnesium_polylepis.1
MSAPPRRQQRVWGGSLEACVQREMNEAGLAAYAPPSSAASAAADPAVVGAAVSAVTTSVAAAAATVQRVARGHLSRVRSEEYFRLQWVDHFVSTGQLDEAAALGWEPPASPQEEGALSPSPAASTIPLHPSPPESMPLCVAQATDTEPEA